jgi:copper(I)-binding protein
MTIVGGDEPDRLVGASTSAASMTQVHSVDESGGMARMRPADGVPIAAKASVHLAPGGLHLMLMDLSRPLIAGDRFIVSLEFQHAGRVDVEVLVLPAGAASPSH